MSVTDENRFQLHRRLVETLGEVEAATLMEHLPVAGWADLATKRDLDQQRELYARDLTIATQSLRSGYETMGADMRLGYESMGADIRAEMQTMGADIRSEMQTMGADIRSEMQTMGADIRSEMQTMGADIRSEVREMRTDLLVQQRNFMVSMMAMNGALAALVVAAVKLI